MHLTHTDAVVVTGSGGTGCGRAIAARFARAGGGVVVSDIDEAGGRETVRLIESDGGTAAFCPADVRDEREVRGLIDFAVRTFGRVTVLVNDASGTSHPGDPLASWAETVQTELLGTMYATRAAIDAMVEGGAIVNMASISALWHGRKTPGGWPAYDAAKAGVIRLTTALGPLARTHRIRVNCLAPGWIATRGPREYWESLTPGERAERGVPSRLLSPGQVADAVFRLATDDSLAGRIAIWWSEDDAPRVIAWGDRGYSRLSDDPWALGREVVAMPGEAG